MLQLVMVHQINEIQLYDDVQGLLYITDLAEFQFIRCFLIFMMILRYRMLRLFNEEQER